MGALSSSLVGNPVNGLTKDELSRLEKRFQKLDIDSSGTISVGELYSLPELKDNPLVQRLVDVMDADSDGEIDFKEFVLGLAKFAAQDQDPEKRLQFIFRIYDIDRDGFISSGELFTVLKMMTGKNLTDKQLQQIVDKTINYLDKDADGRISFDEFKQLIEQNSSLLKVPSMMSVSI